MKRHRLLTCFLTTFMMASFTLTGCGNEIENTRVVFTTGFSNDEVFRIEDSICTLSEAMVYLVNTQEGYEDTFGLGIWQEETDSGTVEQRLKDSVLAKIAQIKAMNLLAQDTGISLTEKELELAETAAKEYYSSLSDADIAAMNNVTEAEINSIYCQQALADKLYEYIIRDINPEISDDEARTITVEQIFLKTYTLDATGEKVPLNDADKRQVYATARTVLSLLKEGNSFEELMSEYNEADEGTRSFGKHEVDSVYEEAAFNLGTGEISDIVETEDGYAIIKCITTFNREETEANKIKIVAQRKREVFGEQYDAFVSTLNKQLNEKLWDSVSLVADENVTTKSLMDVYQKYFGD